MYRALYALLLLLLAGCAGTDSGVPEGPEDPPPDTPAEETQATPEETREDSRPVEARELDSGSFGQGTARPEVRVASSAAELTEELGEEIRDRGPGAYVAALWGRKNTGGYSLRLAGAREVDGRVVIRLSLGEPPEGAMVTQAVTYPYVFIFVPDAAPEDISLTDRRGRELDWPVMQTGG